MSVTVRVAEPTDLEQVGRLTGEAYLVDGLITEESEYLDELRDAARRAEHATVLVAVETVGAGEEVLGTITLVSPGTPYAEIAAPDELELRMLAVSPAARGRGVGELLVREAIERAVGWGAHRVVLSTMTDMVAAQRIYERLGLDRTPQRDWQVNGYVMHVYVLEP